MQTCNYRAKDQTTKFQAGDYRLGGEQRGAGGLDEKAKASVWIFAPTMCIVYASHPHVSSDAKMSKALISNGEVVTPCVLMSVCARTLLPVCLCVCTCAHAHVSLPTCPCITAHARTSAFACLWMLPLCVFACLCRYCKDKLLVDGM